MPGEIDTGGPSVLHRYSDGPKSIFTQEEDNSVQLAQDDNTGVENKRTWWHGLPRELWQVQRKESRDWSRRRVLEKIIVTNDNNELVKSHQNFLDWKTETLNHQWNRGDSAESQADPRFRLGVVETDLQGSSEPSEISSQCFSSSDNRRYINLNSHGHTDHQCGVIKRWFVDTRYKFNAEKKKTKWPSKRLFYIEFVLLLLLIVIGHTRVVKSSLRIATIGTLFGVVGAAPVELDAGIRAERSANLSHITGASRKIRMYIKNRHLQILSDGTVNGSNDDTSDYTIFQRTSVSRGQLRIQGVATCLYLCMDSCGLLYGSREYTEDCLFNETLEQHNYNTYSSVRWSTPRKTLYLGLNRHGQPRRVQARGHNLGRLSAYARVLTQVAPPDRVEALHSRMLGAQHGVRHHHNSHHHRHLQQTVCPTLQPQEKDGRDRFRCRKRKKRKKRKRRCEEGEPLGSHCEIYQRDSGHRANAEVPGEGPPTSKRSCEDAASDEFCRRQALNAPSKKRKSRIEIDSKKENNYQVKKKDTKKKSGKKSSTDAPGDARATMPTIIGGGKRREQISKRNNQGKKKIPNRSTRTTLPVLTDYSNQSSISWQSMSTTVMMSNPRNLSALTKKRVTGSMNIEKSILEKELNFMHEKSFDLMTTISTADSEENSSLQSPFHVSGEPSVSSFTEDSSTEVSGEDLENDDEQTTLALDYSTAMTTMDTIPPERTEDYTKATTPTILKSLEASRRLDHEADASGILERFSFGRLTM
ncbi:uncharacterized protein bnl [Fopius arisanus]|uniref:Fibroblast growth factor n=1 Tax=Fopius arisanus TaxID=64838 RepID=A0A9R1T3Y2_9HYME|nr:PREDICTED: uncharacterized protein LOC105266212 [Fopius arisanus]